MHVATTSSGSAVIGLAGVTGHLTPAQGWEAATVDERWQREKWGADAEALEREDKLKKDFEAAIQFASLHLT